MGMETAANASGEGASLESRDRCVQRTVELTGAEIAAVEAAEMAPNLVDPGLSAAKEAKG